MCEVLCDFAFVRLCRFFFFLVSVVNSSWLVCVSSLVRHCNKNFMKSVKYWDFLTNNHFIPFFFCSEIFNKKYNSKQLLKVKHEKLTVLWRLSWQNVYNAGIFSGYAAVFLILFTLKQNWMFCLCCMTFCHLDVDVLLILMMVFATYANHPVCFEVNKIWDTAA